MKKILIFKAFIFVLLLQFPLRNTFAATVAFPNFTKTLGDTTIQTLSKAQISEERRRNRMKTLSQTFSITGAALAGFGFLKTSVNNNCSSGQICSEGLGMLVLGIALLLLGLLLGLIRIISDDLTDNSPTTFRKFKNDKKR